MLPVKFDLAAAESCEDHRCAQSDITPLSPTERHQLAHLNALPDEAIDTKDIPEAPATNWRFARRGDLYRPVKEPITIRLDSDIVAWFKARGGGRGYQTEINKALRKYVAGRNR